LAGYKLCSSVQLTAECALLKKWVLSPVLKESIELAARRAAGSLF